MFKQILFALILSGSVQAATNVSYLLNGKEITPEQALLASVKGEQVFKCQLVEAKVSKTGTSIGLRNVKRK